MKRNLFIILLISLTAYAGLPPTSTKISGESTYKTTFQTNFGSLTGTRSGVTLTPSQTGTGAMVLQTSPSLTTPNLGTPSTLVLTNATGLPVGTGISGMATGISTFLTTPSSANLATAVTDETGSGSLVFGTSPVLTTPNLGTPSSAVLTNATGLPIGTGVSGLATGISTFLTTPSSSNLASAVTDETGSGLLVFSTSPVLTTPNLGTPSAVTLTNGTGLPIGTGVSGMATGISTFLTTPSSANLASAVTDETGSGSLVFSTSPALTTPNLGTPSAATLTNATGLPLSTGVTGTLGVASGGTGTSTLTANNVILGAGTSTVTFVAPGTSGNVLTSNGTTWASTALTATKSAFISSACASSNEKPATWITSGSPSGDTCDLTVTGFSAIPNCTCSGQAGAGFTACTYEQGSSSTTHLFFRTGYGTTSQATARTIVCHGN